MSESKATPVLSRIVLEDTTNPMFRHRAKGSGFAAEYVFTIAVPDTGETPAGELYRREEAAIIERLHKCRRDYLGSANIHAELAESRRKLAEMAQARLQAEADAARYRREAQTALRGGKMAEAGKSERLALECDERAKNLSALETELRDDPDTIRYCTWAGLKAALQDEAAAIRAEVKARYNAVRANLSEVSVGQLLAELWLTQELEMLTRERTAIQSGLYGDKLGSEIERLAKLDSGFNGQTSMKQPPPDYLGAAAIDRARTCGVGGGEPRLPL